jgi:endonuclease/exonuclease/phosphatase family metal-dependent hydrolase
VQRLVLATQKLSGIARRGTVLIRSWNLFHGNTTPPRRHAYLEEMVRLVTVDRPDVVCLQELPVWSLRRLGEWSGMRAIVGVARSPRLPRPLDRLVTSLNNGYFRSLFTGQANAILLQRDLEALQQSVVVLNPHRALGTGAAEPRICQVVRLPGLLLANLHASQAPKHAAEQVERAAAHVLELARSDEPIVLAGDFNVTPDLRHHDFSEGGPAIDHILVRGGNAGPLVVWPDVRRTLNGMLLSDHAPVERSL